MTDGMTAMGPTAASDVVWLRRLLFAGIAANVVVALVGIASPDTVTELLNLERARPPVWARFSAFLLILLSGFYVFAALDPIRSFPVAVWAVACRFAGVFFFGVIGGNYIAFGLFDAVFGVPQAYFLYRIWRRR